MVTNGGMEQFFNAIYRRTHMQDLALYKSRRIFYIDCFSFSGSYGMNVNMEFSPEKFYLLSQDWVLAFCHVRLE